MMGKKIELTTPEILLNGDKPDPNHMGTEIHTRYPALFFVPDCSNPKGFSDTTFANLIKPILPPVY